MKKYRVKIDSEALADIQGITDWYNQQQAGIGKKFQNATIIQINSLNREPHIYAIRYNEIRCVLIKKFPYQIHFFINEEKQIVEVLAIISTDRNPKIWEEKTGK